MLLWMQQGGKVSPPDEDEEAKMPKRKLASVAKREAIAKHVDTDWFYSRMQDLGISLRGTAALMGLDTAALSRRFHGQNVFDLYEAVDLARHLDAPLTEIVRRCGVEPPAEPSSSITIAGAVNAKGEIEFKKRLPGPSKTQRPFEAPARTTAVRVDASGSPLNGWICFYVPSTKVEAEAIGRLNVVHTSDGRDYLAVLSHGYQRGRWNLRPLANGNELEDVLVASASPVLMVRT